MRLTILAATTVLFSTAAFAEPIGINEALARINGTEVHIAGRFGKLMDNYILQSSDWRFPVELAVDRKSLSEIRDCKILMSLPEKACEVDMLAELRADGGSIVLVAYQITKK